jgi:hypothetical protein
MSRNTLITVIALAVLIILAFFVFSRPVNKSLDVTTLPTATPLPETVPTSVINPSSPLGSITSFIPPEEKTVQVAFISLHTGGTLGCGDSVQYIVRGISDTQQVLKAALTELISLKTQYYGQSGLYNALYQSNLILNSVNVKNQEATIHLSGTVALGGTCDSPRFKAQIEQTALQFPSVKKTTIFINNRPIDEVLSQR